MPTDSPLLEMTAEEADWLASNVVCAAYSESDFSDWEEIAQDPARSPLSVLRKQRQTRNDCQGQSLTNGEEKRRWYCTGQMVQLSDIYAYNGSERAGSARNVGRDQGTSIASGVVLLTEGIKALGVAPGLPLESDWPYNTYERSSSRFDRRAQAVTIDSTFVAQQLPLPPWRDMLACVVAGGGSLHIGTYWRVSWSKLHGRRLMDKAPRGGGGHATEGVWAVKINGTWYLAVWNSHGDGYYLMSERCYEDLRSVNFRPFGARLLMPDKAKERYVNWITDSPWD